MSESTPAEVGKFLTWDEIHWDTLEDARRFGFSEWHMHIFESLYYGYGHVRLADFADRAFGIWQGQYPEQCQAAVDDAFARNWIQVLSPATILGINSDLDSKGYVPAVPEWAVPAQFDEYEIVGGVGAVEFTLEGAELYLRFWISFSPREYAWRAVTTRADPAIVTAYGESEAAIEEMLPLLDDDFESLERRAEPEPLGRWYEEWWKRFNHGVRIEFVGKLTPSGRMMYTETDDNFDLSAS